MTIWEKAIINMQRGVNKINAVGAVLSERVKAEIAIVRLRIRIDEIHARIDELYRIIGCKIADMKARDEMPKTTELLLHEEEISSALNELVQQKKEIDDLVTEIKIEQEALKTVSKEKEDADV
ncbi:MAG: hypothetical protein WC539_00325 [Nitrospirota bacterium]